jgi:ankyrin repeat protein
LHYAATGPEPCLVALLLERGAQVDAPSPNGSTALMMAARYGSDDSAFLLLAKGASTSARNQKDMNAADFARSVGRDALAAKLTPAPR